MHDQNLNTVISYLFFFICLGILRRKLVSEWGGTLCWFHWLCFLLTTPSPLSYFVFIQERRTKLNKLVRRGTKMAKHQTGAYFCTIGGNGKKGTVLKSNN